MPDVVDVSAWPFRGELGHWLGHSLVGIPVCLALGLVMAWGARLLLPQRWISRLDEGAPLSPGIVRAGFSLIIGVVSHDGFDSITHEGFGFLWPWYGNHNIFPSWWYHTWATIPLPPYHEPYPLAPQTIAWIILTIIGAIVIVRCLRRAN
jgi:hypothetical protein